jgi:hypothetical protein
VAGKDVNQLTALEERWLRKQRCITRDRASAYEQAGIYAAWRNIFRQYTLLAEHDLEALKRAIYLCWTERSQNRIMSGIKDLDEGTIQEVLAIANQSAATDRLDAELRWMLSYYHLVEPSYLDRFDDLEDLKRVSKEDPLVYRTGCLKCSFENRGHIGRHWQAKQAILRRWP